ncbi:hypothetical protein Tco_0237910 [Tanacetum coccineum]
MLSKFKKFFSLSSPLSPLKFSSLLHRLVYSLLFSRLFFSLSRSLVLFLLSLLAPDAGFKPSVDDEKKVTKEPGKEDGDPSKENERDDQEKDASVNRTLNNVNCCKQNEVNVVDAKTSIELLLHPNMPELEDYSIFEDDEDVGAETDINNLDTTIQVSPISTTRIHKDHPLD